MNEAKQYESETPVARRAGVLWQMLHDERWSRRQIALAIGASHRYINDRMNGQVDLSFSDIEAIAPLLKMDAPQLFAALHEAENAPAPKRRGLIPAG